MVRLAAVRPPASSQPHTCLCIHPAGCMRLCAPFAASAHICSHCSAELHRSPVESSTAAACRQLEEQLRCKRPHPDADDADSANAEDSWQQLNHDDGRMSSAGSQALAAALQAAVPMHMPGLVRARWWMHRSCICCNAYQQLLCSTKYCALMATAHTNGAGLLAGIYSRHICGARC